MDVHITLAEWESFKALLWIGFIAACLWAFLEWGHLLKPKLPAVEDTRCPLHYRMLRDCDPELHPERDGDDDDRT